MVMADVVGINVGNVPEGPLHFEDHLTEGSKVAVFQIHEALGHLTQSITKMAQYLGLINRVCALRVCSGV